MISKRRLFVALMSLHTVQCIAGFALFVYLVSISPWGSWWFYPLIVVAYTLYYFWVGSRPIQIHCRGSVIHHEVLRGMPCLKGRAYYPTPYLMNRNLQTLFAAAGRPPPGVRYMRERVIGAYSDGETMTLDWCLCPGTTGSHGEKPPVIILFHGLTGGSDDSNMHYLTMFFREKGWHTVIPVRRGCEDGDDAPLTKPKFYDYGGLEDSHYTVEYIAAKMKGHLLFGVGISAGSNVMVNYIATHGRYSRIVGAVSVANGYCWVKGTKSIRDQHPVWDVIMGGMVHHTLFKRHEVFAQHILSGTTEHKMDQAIVPLKRVSSLREVDEYISRKVHNFDNLDEFYAHQSCAPRIPSVVVPTIFLNALDDPIACADNIPKQTIAQNPHTLLVTTESGGHLGWSVGWWPFARKKTWMDIFILEGLESIMTVVNNGGGTMKRQTSLDGDVGEEGMPHHGLGGSSVFSTPHTPTSRATPSSFAGTPTRKHFGMSRNSSTGSLGGSHHGMHQRFPSQGNLNNFQF